MPDPAREKTAYYGFTGLIEPGSAARIASAFNTAVNNGCDEVYLCMSSTGGLVADGIYLYNYIRGLPVQTIIHNIGTVASIATAVYVAAEKRCCSEHGAFMIHPTEMPYQANMRAELLQHLLNSTLADDERTENILSQRTSIPAATLAARRFRDVHITPQKAVEFGLSHTLCEFALPDGNEIFQV